MCIEDNNEDGSIAKIKCNTLTKKHDERFN